MAVVLLICVFDLKFAQSEEAISHKYVENIVYSTVVGFLTVYPSQIQLLIQSGQEKKKNYLNTNNITKQYDSAAKHAEQQQCNHESPLTAKAVVYY